MEKDTPKFRTPFDCQTIPQWLYLIKLILPYFPSNIQRSLAVFIRFQEMQYTLKHFNGFTQTVQHDNLINDLKPYMDPSTQNMMEQMESIMNMMEMIQTLNETDFGNPDGINPMDMFSDFFNMKGDCTHE